MIVINKNERPCPLCGKITDKIVLNSLGCCLRCDKLKNGA